MVGDEPPDDQGLLAQLACVLEVTTHKPGNVSRFADFNDCTFLDFILSAAAIAGPMREAHSAGVGATILEAVRATRRVCGSNTNLGMILLLAPLAAVPAGEPDLRAGVNRVLQALTVQDAAQAYEGIRLARPGGLGQVNDQDVASEPEVTLLQAMHLAADRDVVARQYARAYADVFGSMLRNLRDSQREQASVDRAIVCLFLEQLAREPDTLILRKCGPGIACEASRRASETIAAGWPDRPEGQAAFTRLDAWLRADGHRRNPGATADLVAATLYVALRDGSLTMPLPTGLPARLVALRGDGGET